MTIRRTSADQRHRGTSGRLRRWSRSARDDNTATDFRRAEDRNRHQLEAAIHGRQLSVDLVPIVDLGSDRVVGLDVLVDHAIDRAGRHPSMERASTTRSRQLLSSIGADSVITANGWLVDQAVRSLGSWRHLQVSGDVFVVVMLDDRFIADDSFLATVKSSVRRAWLEPAQLLLSLDSALGFEPMWSTLQRLKSHGVRVALENFTLGSPATELLRRFPIDAIRVDVASLADRPDAGADELQAIVQLAHNLRCRVMTEAVTTLDLARVVRDSGCDEGSGRAIGHGLH